jgi:hypothetical protein
MTSRQPAYASAALPVHQIEKDGESSDDEENQDPGGRFSRQEAGEAPRQQHVKEADKDCTNDSAEMDHDTAKNKNGAYWSWPFASGRKQKMIPPHVKDKAEKILIDMAFPGQDKGIVCKEDFEKLGFALPVAVLYQACFLAMFFTFFAFAMIDAQSARFIAPADTGSTSSGQICEPVSIENSGRYRIDSNGVWEGQTGFEVCCFIQLLKNYIILCSMVLLNEERC